MYEKLEELDRIARYSSLYEIDEDLLTHGLINGYLAGTGDSDAVYLSGGARSAATLTTGLGIYTVPTGSGYLYIYNVIEGISGASAGLQIGDTISTVNGQDVLALGVEAAQAIINGEEGSAVQLEVFREGEKLNFTAACQIYSHIPVTYSIRDYQIGYLKISEFGTNTFDQFSMAINNLVSAGITGLTIDLRHCGGGDLDSALKALDRLLPVGDLMYKTTRDGSVELVATSGSRSLNVPMTVLVDAATSGPAELFAIAMYDFGKADIVGTTTAGNGTLTQTFTLSDGSAVVLSTALINPPSSAPFNGVGVTPNFAVSLQGSTDYDYYSLALEDDPQFKKAYEVVLAQIEISSVPVEEPETPPAESDPNAESSQAA